MYLLFLHTQVKLANDDIIRIVHRKDRPDCSRFPCTHLVIILGSVYHLSTLQYTPVYHLSTLQYITLVHSSIPPHYTPVHSSISPRYTPVHSSIS